MASDLLASLRGRKCIAVVASVDADITFLLPLIFSASALLSPILFFSTTELYLHYSLVARKLGSSLANSPLFSFVDVLSAVHDGVVPTLDAERSSSDPVSPQLSSGKMIAAEMMQMARAFLEKHSSANPMLVLDDLMPLVYAGLSINESTRLIRGLASLCEQHAAVLITVSSSALGYLSNAVLLRTAISVSDCMVVSRGLGSGFSADVHGQLLLLRGPRFQKSESALVPMAMQYQVSDTGINFFGRGLAAGVV